MRITPPFKACVFDLDGTLLNTLPTILRHCNHSLAAFGFGPITPEQCRAVCRLPASTFYHVLLEMAGCPANQIPALATRLAAYDLEHYLQDAVEGSAPYPGILETLAALRGAGIKTAILTNKPEALAKTVSQTLLPGLFEYCAGQQPGGIAKPNPLTLQRVLSKLGIDKTECVYVGDTDVDMETAKNAGVFLAAVAWGYMPAETLSGFHPNILLQHPRELLPLFHLQA